MDDSLVLKRTSAAVRRTILRPLTKTNYRMLAARLKQTLIRLLPALFVMFAL
jgi:hypothetical protein